MNFTALETRLSHAWPSRTASPGTTSAVLGHVDGDLDAGGGRGDADGLLGGTHHAGEVDVLRAAG